MKNVTRVNGGTVIYDSADWKAGLGPQGKFTATQFLKQGNENGFVKISSIDPFTSYGALSPSTASSATATGGTLAGTMVAFDLINNTNGLGVDAGGKTWSVNLSTNTLTAVGTITGTTPVGQDGIIYRHKVTATTYITSYFYSYYNTVNWNVGVMTDVTSPSNNDTFMSATVDAPRLDITTASPADGKDVDQINAPHPMEVGADGILYIGSGRYLHAYDGNSGTAGTYTSQVLKLPLGFQITALKKYQDSLLIVGNYYSTQVNGSGTALMYVWNYTDLDVSSVIPLEDSYVSALFLWRGSPTVITSGAIERNGRNKVKVITGNSVSKVADFDGVIPNNRSVLVLNNVLYLNAGGLIHTVGNRFVKSDAINNIASLSNPGISGVLFFNDVNSCIAGSSSDGTPCFNNINNGHGTGSCKTFLFTPELPLGKIAKIKWVQVEYFQVLAVGGTNGNFTLQINTDSNSTSNTIIANAASVALPLIKKYDQTTAGGILPSFYGFELVFNWAASTGGASPVISRVLVDYELADVPLTI